MFMSTFVLLSSMLCCCSYGIIMLILFVNAHDVSISVYIILFMLLSCYCYLLMFMSFCLFVFSLRKYLYCGVAFIFNCYSLTCFVYQESTENSKRRKVRLQVRIIVFYVFWYEENISSCLSFYIHACVKFYILNMCDAFQ